MGIAKNCAYRAIINKIKQLEEEIRKTPYHKGTEHHIGLLKAKIARMKRELEEKEGRSGGGGVGYAIRKQGDASCVLVGPPSSGKSTLLNVLTGAQSKTGCYDFTTLTVVPGIMEYRGAKIQILDLPGLIEGAAEGRGDGRKIISAIRGSDLVILMTDVDRLDWFKKINQELYRAGIRLNQQPPKVEMKKTNRGGIRIIDPFNYLSKEMVVRVAQEFGIKNAEIVFQEPIRSIDQLIDIFSGNRVYLSAIEVVSQIDKKPGFKTEHRILVSAKEGIGLNQLKEAIWQGLGLIRVYLKRSKSAEPDFGQPLILRKGATVADAIEKISSELLDQTGEALIWGSGAKFPGQPVPLSFLLKDETVLYFAKK